MEDFTSRLNTAIDFIEQGVIVERHYAHVYHFL